VPRKFTLPKCTGPIRLSHSSWTELRRLKMLEDENSRLKRIVADLTLDKQILQEVVRKNVWSASHLQGSVLTKGSLHKCIRPLASGLLLQPGHDEIRTQGSQ
jgi:putative transposase